MIGSAGHGEGGAREGRGRAPLRPGSADRAADQAAGDGDAGVRQLLEDGDGQRQAARRAEDRAAAALTEIIIVKLSSRPILTGALSWTTRCSAKLSPG